MTHKTRVLLADDHRMVREGLKRLLEAEPDIDVVGEAEDGRSAVAMVRELSPDVVVMDVNMPNLNGIESARQVRAGRVAGDGTRVIALSGQSDRRSTSEMLRAGATGYVLKSSAFEELVQAVRTVMTDRVYLSPSVAGTVVDAFVSGTSDGTAPPPGCLSGREREVLQLIAEGKATKEVATHLHVSVKTVETHRRNLMYKLQVDSVAGLTKYAIREGITSLEH